MRGLVLDAGALIALERFDRLLWRRLVTVRKRGGRLVVPASALAEAWRGGPRSAPLARLLGAGEIDPLDEGRAKEVGVRLGERGTQDVADAHVVCCALECRGVIVTSDPKDIESLAAANERLSVTTI